MQKYHINLSEKERKQVNIYDRKGQYGKQNACKNLAGTGRKLMNLYASA